MLRIPLGLLALCSSLACSSPSSPRSKEAPNPAPTATPAGPAGAATPPAAAEGKPAKPAVDADAAKSSTLAADKPIEIFPLLHASLYLRYGELVVHIDPTSAASGHRSDVPKADLILVTDIHFDHLEPDEIARLRKPGAPVVSPAAAADKIKDATVLANGEKKELLGIGIEAVPMYNVERKNKDGELFHPKGRGNGYVLTIGGKRLYVAGDTECIPEMKALTQIDAAFVCMNLPYTMPVEEAAECVRAFKPAVVFPYHYKGQDVAKFTGAVAAAEGVKVRVLDWYPGS